MIKENKNTQEDKINELETSLQALITINKQLTIGHNTVSDDLDLKALWNSIWNGKWIIIAIAFFFTLSSIVFSFTLPNEYKSTALLVPASSSASSSLSKLAGQFGGLASLAGINLSAGDSNDNSVVAMRILKTWDFLEVFIKENNIQAEVFAGNGWDSTKNKLLIDSDIYDQTSQKWTRKFDATKGEKAEPSSWELYEKIKDRISIVQEKSSGLISLSVVYYSPELAKLWTDELVKSINWHIQKQEREDAIKTIAYLNAKIKETNVADMQSVFYQLIEEQTKTLMLAEVSSEYVFKTISPAKVAEEHSKPRRLIIVIIGLLFGTFTGMVFVLIKSSR